ncbi:hypothetical protein N7522_000635 [Penicillium canescens]|nr:hypothetical protein N7522_000635 [Penicillium canescens]
MATEKNNLSEDVYQYSMPVSPGLYSRNPDYFSTFKPRIHKSSQLSADATIQCQIDLFGKDNIGMVMGNIDTFSGDWTALTYPFCCPDRLAMAAYMVDFAFIHDDVDYKGTIQTKIYDSGSDERDKALRTGTYAPKWLDEGRNQQVIAKTMYKLVEIDGTLGPKFIQQWENWKRSEKEYAEVEAQRCENLQSFLTLCYYLRGCQWAFAMARFAYKLELTEEEDQLVLPLTQLIMEVLTLHNDYYSWEKEDAFYRSSEDKLPMANAVTLYMRWYSLSPSDAKAAIRAKAIEKEEQYLLAKEEFLKRHVLPPPATVRWLEIIEHMVAGNLLWSLTCPRYHQKPNNQYVDYYNMRCRQGYIFPDDCTRLHTFVGFQDGCEPQATTKSNGYCVQNNANMTDNISGLNEDASTEDLTASIDQSLMPFDETVIRNPSSYVMALPSKRLREKFICSLNQWFQVPEETVQIIESAVKLLHNGSIMLDDIQDQSPLRRGKPSTHVIYGLEQTMNSAYFLCVQALQEIYSMSHRAVPIYIEELKMLHLGQAQELYWTYHGIVPSKEDHMKMIDGKTTSLFRMAARLLQSEAKANRNLNISKFVATLGRFFQVRDDYQNLVSAEYSNSKGFCEDLDEGKFSLPVIHALQEEDNELQAIFEQRKRSGKLTHGLKQRILDRLREKGSLDYTFGVLQDLYLTVGRELDSLEDATGQKNWMLRMLLQHLKV